MKKMTITLELTFDEVTAVIALLSNTSPDSISEPSRPLTPSQDESPSQQLSEPTDAQMAAQLTTILQHNNIPVVVKPTAGKKTIMPTFGRTQAQIDSFAKKEEERVEANDEEAELRAQRKADRDERKAIKDEEEAAKKFQQDKIAAEVEAIKAAEVTTIPIAMPKKPWQL